MRGIALLGVLKLTLAGLLTWGFRSVGLTTAQDRRADGHKAADPYAARSTGKDTGTEKATWPNDPTGSRRNMTLGGPFAPVTCS